MRVNLDLMEYATDGAAQAAYVASDSGNFQSYSEAVIKTQGSYSLKAIAAITDSINDTLTKTIGTPIDLTDQTKIKFDFCANRLGENLKIGIRDTGTTTTEITPERLNGYNLSLNGSGYASIADASQKGLDMGLSDFMIEARVKTSYSADAQHIVAKLKNAAPTDGYAFRINTTGTFQLQFREIYYTRSNNIVNDGEWHYVVALRDQSSATGLKLFIGGSEVSYGRQDDAIGFNVDTSQNFQVGAKEGNNKPFVGQIDEIPIWNFGKDGLPADYEAYITWRNANPYAALSEYDSDAWAGYADANRSELTTNGDMEADSTWEPRGTPTTEQQSTDQKHGGSNSWKIVSDATGEGAYQDITTVVGKWYEVRGWVYVTAGDAKLGKEDTDGSDQVLTGQATAASWTEFCVIFQATETTSRIFFQSDATAASTFYVDDVETRRTGLVSHYKFENDYLDEGSNDNDLSAGGSGNSFPLAWQEVEWDISGVANADKDSIDRIILTVVNADAAAIFYIDNMRAPGAVPLTGTSAIALVTAGVLTRGTTELMTATAGITLATQGLLMRREILTATAAIVTVTEGDITVVGRPETLLIYSEPLALVSLDSRIKTEQLLYSELEKQVDLDSEIHEE